SMKLLARCPLVSVAALTTYLMVHVVAPATHHHHATETRCAWSPRTTANCYLVSGVLVDDNDNDEDHCPVCGVLHMAQMAPTLFDPVVVISFSDELFSVAAPVRPFPIIASTPSRAPPH